MERRFNINFEPDSEKVLSSIADRCKSGAAGYICVADGNILSMVHKDLEYRKVVDGAMFSILDSSWIPLMANRIYGTQWKQFCGSQIFAEVTRMRKYRMYFLGANRTVLDALRGNMLEVDPAITSMKFKELPFCSVDEFDYEGIAAEINEDNPDIVWLSLGAPKQEIFASKLTPLLRRGVVIPVGAVFDFRAGLGKKRAPQWMIKTHLEWMYRIFSEPRKQLGRCAVIIRTFPFIYKEEKKHNHKHNE